MKDIIRGEIIIEIIKYIFLYRICMIDIKRKIISDKYLIMLFFLNLIESFIKMDFEKYYLGMCIFSLPLLFLYITEDYFNKEFIGFGDIKLMIVLGGGLQLKIPEVISRVNIQNVLDFYMYLYIISGIFSFLLLVFIKIYNKVKNRNKNIKYLHFAPFLVITYIIMEFKLRGI